MLLFEAANEFKARLQINDYKDSIPEYYEAMEIAVKCIHAQIRLADLLNDFYCENEEHHKNDMYSRKLCLQLLESFRFDKDCEDDDDA